MSFDNKNFFQIYLSDQELQLPQKLRQHQRDFKDYFSSFRYELFNHQTLRDFVQKFYGGEVLWAYDCLKPYAFKADLGRYCLLYALGGWYADITLKPMMSVAVDQDTRLVYFYDHGQGWHQAVHGCQNGLIYASKQLELMGKAIETVVRHCKEKYYGPNPLSATGPNMFGQLIAGYAPALGYHNGYFMQLTPLHDNKNRAYIGPGGEIIAFHKTAWCREATEASLSQFGAKGVNNYAKMWMHREVYK